MTENRQGQLSSSKSWIAWLALTLAGVALAINFLSRSSGSSNQAAPGAVASSLGRTLDSKVLRAGYSGFKPYTITDPGNPDKPSGFCVDLIEEIAKRQTPPWKVEWSQVTFETLKADMESGRFDVFADAVYQTVARASQFGFTDPYSYFGVAVGIVRADDGRFQTFSDLEREDITVVLAEGWTATEYALQHLTKPNLKLVPVGDDPFVQLQEVLLGRADIALQDVPTVLQFAQAHPDTTRALWLDNPPTRVPAGFMTRKSDWEMIHFLNVSLRALEADGTITTLQEKWNALSDFPVQSFTPGAGLISE